MVYATKDLFVKEESPPSYGPRFASDYDELMWLAERQKHHLSNEETQRFFHLRQEWTEMHDIPAIGRTPSRAGPLALSA